MPLPLRSLPGVTPCRCLITLSSLLYLSPTFLAPTITLCPRQRPDVTAAATASMRRKRTTCGGASGGATGTMLQFYTDDAPGLKISPNVVLVKSIGFIAFIAILHVMGKLYFMRREAQRISKAKD